MGRCPLSAFIRFAGLAGLAGSYLKATTPHYGISQIEYAAWHAPVTLRAHTEYYLAINDSAAK